MPKRDKACLAHTKTFEEIVIFAKSQGYESVEYSGKWGNYEVYEPIYNKEYIACIGLPLIILVKGVNIRMSTQEEAFKFLDENI